MDHLFLIGILAASLTTFSFLPQVIKAYKTKHTKDLSLVMYLLLCLGLSLWLVYGVLIESLPLIIANSATMGLCFFLISLKIKYG